MDSYSTTKYYQILWCRWKLEIRKVFQTSKRQSRVKEKKEKKWLNFRDAAVLKIACDKMHVYHKIRRFDSLTLYPLHYSKVHGIWLRFFSVRSFIVWARARNRSCKPFWFLSLCTALSRYLHLFFASSVICCKCKCALRVAQTMNHNTSQ